MAEGRDLLVGGIEGGSELCDSLLLIGKGLLEFDDEGLLLVCGFLHGNEGLS